MRVSPDRAVAGRMAPLTTIGSAYSEANYVWIISMKSAEGPKVDNIPAQLIKYHKISTKGT